MFPDIHEIKQKRIKLGLKQSELAYQAGVSQSLIAKLESGKIEPSYDKVRKIFETLNRLEEKKEQKCSEIMKKHVISVDKNNTVEKAAKLMRSHEISQLPVFDGHHAVGSIGEGTILDSIDSGIEKEKLFKMHVKEIMEDPFPIVNKETSVKSIVPLLKNKPVLISEKGKIIGIITKADLL
ncbi:CBS domain-containing protein [Candidatus Pacearchaeota archaeon]|nr:CBS domain-containing protein [Candidatus Pacearchaeota archaeon]